MTNNHSSWNKGDTGRISNIMTVILFVLIHYVISDIQEQEDTRGGHCRLVLNPLNYQRN